MKWLTTGTLLNINQELMSLCANERNLFGQIESFVLDQNDMKNFKAEIQNQKEQQHSTKSLSRNNSSQSYENNKSEQISPNQHKFQILKSAIETSFPDFDFSYATPDHFRYILSPEAAQNSIYMSLSTYFTSAADFSSKLWLTLENEIQLNNCDIYSYEPTCTDAFTAMGSVWKMSYFFYNVKQKKIVHFHLREGGSAIEDFGSDDDEINFNYEVDNT